MSEQKAAPIPEDLKKMHHDAQTVCPEYYLEGGGVRRLIERIAALTAEVATLKEEVVNLREWEECAKQLDKAKLPCGHNARYGYTEDGGKHGFCTLCELARLSVPVTEQAVIINSLLLRLNDRLVDMKPEWDDSITGFNEAMEIVRDALQNPVILARATPPQDAPQT